MEIQSHHFSAWFWMLAQDPHIHLSSVSSGVYLCVHTQCARLPSLSIGGCIGIQQTSSCQQEVALTLLFSVLWASSLDPLFLPHGVKFTWTTPTRLVCMPIFPTPRHLKPGDLLLVLGTPILELLSQWIVTSWCSQQIPPGPSSLNGKRYANFSTTGPGTYQMTNKDLFFSWKKLINKIS